MAVGSSAIIVPLSEAPLHADKIAQWHYDEWGHLYPESAKAEFFSDMRRCATSSAGLPQTWLAMVGDEVAGTISVLEEDLESHRHLSPWLMNVLVEPKFRGQGIASMMVEHVKRWASSQPIETLYLYTEDQQRLYQRQGFEAIDEAAIAGHPITIMKIAC